MWYVAVRELFTYCERALTDKIEQLAKSKESRTWKAEGWLICIVAGLISKCRESACIIAITQNAIL